MGFIGNDFVGTSLTNGYQGVPEKREYVKITLYGEAEFDNLHILNYEMTDAEIQAISVTDETEWVGETLLLSEFDNENLSAGNITDLSESVLYWDIYRLDVDENLATFLTTISSDIQEYVDLTCAKGKTYSYMIYGIGETQASSPLISDEFTSDYYNHILINPSDSSELYIFNYNAQTDNITNETDMTRYDGFSQYSAYSFGNRDFEIGTISAIVSDIDSVEYSQPIELINSLRSFINNKQNKIYKNRKGEVYYVMTTNMSRNVINDGLQEQPYNISFKWEETGKLA